MKRLLMIATLLVIPASALAQVPPPAPRPAPVPSSPIAAPVAPAPVVAPMPEGYLGGLFDQTVARDAMERARWAMEDSRLQMESMKWDMAPMHFDMQDVYSVASSSSSAYESGLSLLSRRD